MLIFSTPTAFHQHFITFSTIFGKVLSTFVYNTVILKYVLSNIWNKCTLPFKNYISLALAGVVQWIGHQPANQRVASSIPSQGMCLGCGPGPWLRVCERQSVDVSLTHQCFSPSLLFSLKINKIFKKVIFIRYNMHFRSNLYLYF